uniref:G_PROTEIN_RECEP_F1_2 domain-containing protein n=1 Tax=Ascaris lumbricoides TaxID=6252 RepID=A0A0M3HKB2_ASCLU
MMIIDKLMCTSIVVALTYSSVARFISVGLRCRLKHRIVNAYTLHCRCICY